jgi:hypothetical protein
MRARGWLRSPLFNNGQINSAPNRQPSKHRHLGLAQAAPARAMPVLHGPPLKPNDIYIQSTPVTSSWIFEGGTRSTRAKAAGGRANHNNFYQFGHGGKHNLNLFPLISSLRMPAVIFLPSSPEITDSIGIVYWCKFPSSSFFAPPWERQNHDIPEATSQGHGWSTTNIK